MSGALRIEHADGQPVIVKEASGAEAVDLRAEADRLASAAHPGVVRLLSSEGDDDRWELRTAHGGRPLDVGPRVDAPALATIAAAVATTLADLHAVGVVHGRLRAGHILVGASGRPVLCGFGPRLDQPATPEDDVAALGQILIDHLAGDQSPEPIPERRWRRRQRWSGWARASLLTIADQACADPPSRRPSARRLAASISESFPVDSESVVARTEAPDEPGEAAELDPMDALRRSAILLPSSGARRSAGSLVGGVAAVVLGGALILRSQVDSRPASTSTTEPTTTTSIQEERIRIDGTVVSSPRGRFEVGQPGDLVEIGDFDCDGERTPAVLRPSTGEVFVFPQWSTTQEVSVRAVRAVPGARELLVIPLSSGCATLQVRLEDGEVVPITSATAR